MKQPETPETHSISALKAKKHIGSSKQTPRAGQHSLQIPSLEARFPFCTELVLPLKSLGKAWHCHRTSRHCPTPALVPKDFFSLAKRHVLRGLKSWAETQEEKKKGIVLTLSSWKGQEEKANFVLLVDSIYNPHLCMESALQWYCYAVLARDCVRWPLRAQHSTRIIPYKRFALNVMKQMTKSINLQWCGYHKNDVNSGFTVVMKLFRIIIKTSTTFFFRIKAPFDNHRWTLQEIFNKCIRN